jgi:hypothetical protein
LTNVDDLCHYLRAVFSGLLTLQEPKYRQVSFYTRVTFLKKSCKSNTKFPFTTVFFLGVRGLKTSYIVYDYATSGHMNL